MHWVLEYDYVDDYLERRQPFRQAHLALAEVAQRRGALLFAGTLDDPVTAALLVFQADDPSVVGDFVRADPYVDNGVVVEWRIRPWNVVVGGRDAPGQSSPGGAS
ncbi:MAG TPA: YciI-like protein [Acidimicrobiales bacterium]|nr:YciI-like protein [Acidimicrobiales bacterium]